MLKVQLYKPDTISFSFLKSLDLYATAYFKVAVNQSEVAMVYTVNKLAKISGVSARTLRFYDQIGLLKPAYVGDNDYRYYEEEQLLMLQQILFYRELDFPLSEIQKIVNSDTFDKIESLQSHKRILEQGLDRSKKMIKTIDKTISHLMAKEKMKDEELYYGFDSEKQKKYEEQLIAEGIVTQKYLDEFKKKIISNDKEKFIQEGKKINDDLILAMNEGLKPSSAKVQVIMRRHHAWVGWSPTKEGYLGLSQRYLTPEFKNFYDQLHPKLLEYIIEAMQIFSEKSL